MMNLRDKTIYIVGAARSGLAVARFVLEQGARVKISDTKTLNSIEPQLGDLQDHNRVTLETERHSEDFISDADYVILSPGVPKNALPVLWAQQKGIPIMNEIELAFQYCSKPIIAVTGSNGKTTTVTLIAEILRAAQKKVGLCGNIGKPFIDEIQKDDVDYYVVELSSFQLEWIQTFRPLIGVFLNFSQNHLDRHPDLEDYFCAKKRLFMSQKSSDWALLNQYDQRMVALAPTLKSKVVFFNDKSKLKRHQNPNYLVVLEVASILGIPDKICYEVFEQFKGVEHRLEYVCSMEGVDFINDSKSTTVEAGRWALVSIDRPVIMLCGGRDKNSDFQDLAQLVSQKVKKMIVYGEAAAKLAAAFSCVVPVQEVKTLDEAVQIAKQCARSGDVVLLSPMCASFDLFEDYEHRGRYFKGILRESLVNK